MEQRVVEEKARLKALREAARIGASDIDAGLFRRFATPVELNRHLGAIVDKTVPGKSIGSRSK